MNKIIACVNHIITNYLNDKVEKARLENNMIYYRNQVSNTATTKQAFSWAIQPPISLFTSNREEEQTICNVLWQVLESKNHSITRLW